MLEEVSPAIGLNRAPAVAFALSRCQTGAPVMFVVPAPTLREMARPSLYGAGAFQQLLLVTTRTEADALWAIEQALLSGALGGVIGAVERATLTQSRRVDFAARDGGTPAFLLRTSGSGLSAARRRWRVAALPSAGNRHDQIAPGRPRLFAELWRRRDGSPGHWHLDCDDATGRFLVAGRLGFDGVDTAARQAA
jgi:protein ImuA